jgi:hypothetical protein
MPPSDLGFRKLQVKKNSENYYLVNPNSPGGSFLGYQIGFIWFLSKLNFHAELQLNVANKKCEVLNLGYYSFSPTNWNQAPSCFRF